MKQFIHKDQMNNSIFFAVVELVVLFMFKNSIHTSDVMGNTFSFQLYCPIFLRIYCEYLTL